MHFIDNLHNIALTKTLPVEKTILKCAIVDDSTLQRLSIVRLIEMHPSLELVGEYKNAVEAKMGLVSTEIDLIFLDIEMPILSGFDLLDDIQRKPQVIFVTGKTKYAFKAFDYDAVDYLKKPVAKDRFLNSVHKAITNHKLKSEESFDEEDFIFVKSNLKKRKIFLSELRYIEALGDYVKLVTEHDAVVVLSTMKAFQTLLPTERFLRIHKSFIINLNKVQKYNSRTIELDKDNLPLSRNRKADLINALAALENV